MRGSRLLIIILLGAILCGCNPTKYVPVTEIRTEYRDKDNSELLSLVKSLTERLYQRERQVDSLMQLHSERLVLNDRGDTLRHDRETVVYRSSYRERELERLLESKTDSIQELKQKLESMKADSIPVPYPVKQELTRWEQTKMDFGGMAIGGLVAVILASVTVWIAKLKRRKI